MKHLSAFLILLALTVHGSAQTGRRRSTLPAQESAESYLRNIGRLEMEAAVKGDISILESILAEDYTETDPNGDVFPDRHAVLENYKQCYAMKCVESAMVRAVSVRLYGNAAVVNTSIEMKFRGKDASERFKSMDVWVNRGGKWKRVAQQNTRVIPVRTQQRDGMVVRLSRWAKPNDLFNPTPQSHSFHRHHVP